MCVLIVCDSELGTAAIFRGCQQYYLCGWNVMHADSDSVMQ